MGKLRYIASVILCLFCLTAGAQDLPTLERSKQIVSGRFSNGISYYLVPNALSKGYANFALVQKGVESADEVREGLDALPHFGSKAPYRYLAGRGVGYGESGFIRYSGNAAIYDFEGVPLEGASVSDSTLVLILDLVARSGGEQAVIVSGDIDAARVKEQLRMLLLTVPVRGLATEMQPYEWKPVDAPKVIHYGNRTSGLAEISVSYASPRTPEKYMSTPQPLVSQMYAMQLGHIFRKRAEEAFAREGVALAYADFNYTDSSVSPSDERYEFSVGVPDSMTGRATELLSGVLAGLDEEGASAEEYSDSKSRFDAYSVRSSLESVSDRTFVDSCIANYLYGSNLPDPKAVYDFFRGRKISPLQDLSLFNRFVAALLDPGRNLTLDFSTPADTLNSEALLGTFVSSWKPVESLSGNARGRASDTLGLYYPVGKKLKVKTEADEPLTGGKLWTFSNGMKVVFRKTADTRVRYALMIRGGCPEVPGILPGESAFVGDMLGLYDVCGMNAMEFRNMLDANGVSMRCDVSVSDMRISGTATSSKIGLVLRSLLSIQKNRTLNMETFGYYKACEDLRQQLFRLGTDGVNAVTDSIMCPDYPYPSAKSMGSLSDDLPRKAEEYFAAQFHKNNDGVLFIEGDVDPDSLQKLLCRTLGGFATGRTMSVRPRVDCQLRSGWSTYTVDRSSIGDGRYSVNVAISALRPYTMQNWCSFCIAVDALRGLLVRELAPYGLHIEITPELQLQPVERVTVFINCHPCPPNGLPLSVEDEDPFAVLGALRDALAKLSAPMSAGELKAMKTNLSNRMASDAADPDFVMDACLRRYSEGKDLVTNYKTYLDRVSLEDVEAVLFDLSNGSKVEYVIK